MIDIRRVAFDALVEALDNGERNRDRLRSDVHEGVTLGRVPSDEQLDAIDEAIELYDEVLADELAAGKRLDLACSDSGKRATVRPCPHTACRYHLGTPREPGMPGRAGTVARNESSTCSLDVAEDGGHTLKEVGTYIGLTRERVRQIERRALNKLKAIARRHDIDLSDIIPRPRHALDSGVRNDNRDAEKLRATRDRWRLKQQIMKRIASA